MSSAVDFDQRLRPHPEERFSPPQIEIDLGQFAAQLRAEPNAGEAGHRQEAIYKADGLTIALFVFEPGGSIPAHRADGVMNMHLLRGRVRITAEGQEHELRDGQILVLAPEVEYAVRAEDESEMLVTVHLTGGGQSARGPSGEAESP